MAGILDAPHIQRIIPPFVTLLIFFLTFFPQYLFTLTDDPESPFYLSPGLLTPFQLKYMNTWALYILYTYYKTVRTDSGRYLFSPQTLRTAAKRQGITNPPEVPTDPSQRTPAHFAHLKFPPGTRWCRKCSTPKPPRAHHCKLCARCIPRMDHHCPWTANCVSLTTAPHFLRFVLSTTIGLWVLFRLVLQRATWVFSLRDQPAYLGPDIRLLAALLFLLLVNLVTALALSLIAFQSARSALLNETMIEGWQKDRHASLLAKGPTWFPTPDGDSVRLQHVEFPYDIDFLTNISESMSSYNPTLWLFPLTWTPRLGSVAAGLGWEYPENGINRLPGMWPPPDPQKKPSGSQNGRWPAADLGKAEQDSALLRKSTVEEQKRAFRERQMMDRARWAASVSSGRPGYILREVGLNTDMLAAYTRGGLEKSEEEEEEEEEEEYVGGIRKVVGGDENYELFDGPAPMWRNAEGETLEDYGVEKDEGSDEDVPIGELVRRKKLSRGEK